VLVSHVRGRAQMRLAVETYRGPLTPLTQPHLGHPPRLWSVALRMSLHSAASGSDRSKPGIAFATGAIGNEAATIDNGQIFAGPDIHMLVVSVILSSNGSASCNRRQTELPQGLRVHQIAHSRTPRCRPRRGRTRMLDRKCRPARRDKAL
jgi:hypothetical protein